MLSMCSTCKKCFEKYLGLPAIVGRDKINTFMYMVERVRGKINNWMSKFPSLGGKEVLIKAMVQAIPSTVCMFFNFQEVYCLL